MKKNNPNAWWNISTIYLVCSHCEVEFIATSSQAFKSRYEPNLRFFCSKVCRLTKQSMDKTKPKLLTRQCPVCRVMFNPGQPSVNKQFCSLSCYVKSPRFAGRRKGPRPSKRNKKGILVPCLQCKTQFYNYPSSKKKFCSLECYRRYMADRFDRWIASPQNIGELRGYDEFMLQEKLPCLVEGCNWMGKNLSLHVNQTHGIVAEEFKRAAGFNLGTGLINQELFEKLSERPLRGIAIFAVDHEYIPNTKNYRSREGREHAKKARALTLSFGPHPERKCMNCGNDFQQSTPFGLTKFCGIKCREIFYRAKRQR